MNLKNYQKTSYQINTNKDIIKIAQTSESKVISSNKTKYTLEDLNKILNTDLKLNDYLFDFEKNQTTEKKKN